MKRIRFLAVLVAVAAVGLGITTTGAQSRGLAAAKKCKHYNYSLATNQTGGYTLDLSVCGKSLSGTLFTPGNTNSGAISGTWKPLNMTVTWAGGLGEVSNFTGTLTKKSGGGDWTDNLLVGSFTWSAQKI